MSFSQNKFRLISSNEYIIYSTSFTTFLLFLKFCIRMAFVLTLLECELINIKIQTYMYIYLDREICIQILRRFHHEGRIRWVLSLLR